jgi:hypothetical protein
LGIGNVLRLYKGDKEDKEDKGDKEDKEERIFTNELLTDNWSLVTGHWSLNS